MQSSKKSLVNLFDYSAVQPMHSRLSISQLLGRDYLFIDIRSNNEGFTPPNKIPQSIEKIVAELKLDGNKTLFISLGKSANDKLLFIRHEVIWHLGEIAKLQSIAITDEEQQDFMMMIWQCSAAVEPS